MSLFALRQAVVDYLRATLPEIEVDTHPGRFDLREINRYGVRQPTIRVAVLSSPVDNDRRSVYLRVNLVAYIVTRTDRQFDAEERAMAITEVLCSHLHASGVLSVDGASRPDNIQAQNLYSSAVDKKGIHLAVVNWQQLLALPDLVDPSVSEDFAVIAAEYDFAPYPAGAEPGDGVDANDLIDLTEEAPGG